MENSYYHNPYGQFIMELITNSEDLILRASRGFIKDWYSNKEPTTDKPQLDAVLRVFRKEPTVIAGIRAISDEVLKNGIRINSKNKQLKADIEKKLEEKFRFGRLLKKLVYNLMIYGNAFIEIVYKNNQPDELHLLETTEMEIISDEHGEIRAYRQNHGQVMVDFTPDEVIHISINNITSGVWGEVDLQALYKTITMKHEIENLIVTLFKTNKFRDAWKVSSTSNNGQIKDIAEVLKNAREFPDKELFFVGEIEKIAGREIKDLKELVALIDYCRQEILTLMRVPPIIAGIPDNSNRSNSEVQARKAFDTRIKSIQATLADELSKEMFPLMGWSNAWVEFPPIDKRAEKDDIEIIMALKTIGLDSDSLLQYIRDVGIELPEGAKIEEPMFTGKNPMPPSRKPEDKSAPVKHETGSNSTTREEQLMGRSTKWEIGPEDVEEVLG